MKNVIKTLNSRKEEVEQKFNQLEQERQSIIQSQQKLQAGMNEIVSEMARLQGERRGIIQSIDDFKDEPKKEK